jgi:poly-gamma-glutamate synthesis protein (capsule biosynthesis protein)
MNASPLQDVRAAASTLRDAGAALVAGTSAHVFQGVEDNILFDLGDFLDDYAVNRQLRNDLGLLFLIELEPEGPQRIEAVPLKLDFCFTRLARDDDAAWIRRRFRDACAGLGTEVLEEGGRLLVAPA